MSSTNNASAYVGRLGGLAVALGIGTAILSGAGMAWAAPSDSGSGGASSSTGSSAPAKAKSTASSARTPKKPTVQTASSTTVASKAPAAAAAKPSPAKGANRLLSAVGLNLVGTGLASSGRREVAPASAAATVSTAAVVTTAPTVIPSYPVGWVTGQSNTAYPGIGWPQTNNTAGFGIWGTDLGIMWENTLTGKIQLAFGDTFSGPNMTGDWRSNVLLLSTDKNLTNGLSLLQTGYAYQFIPSAPSALFPFFGSEVTNIPTSAISVLDQQYVSYMSVKSWDTPGRWTTNYAGISVYNEATDKWVLAPSTIRSASWFGSSHAYVPGNQNFQQSAFVLEPADQVAPGETQYLYAFGTPSGRAGSAYLSRVAVDDVTNLAKYQYWNGNDWVTGKPVAATPIIGDSTRSAGLFGPVIDWANNPNVLGGMLGGLFGAKTGGNVSEMSVQYNDYLGKYVMMYADGNNNVKMRYADEPNGAWSAPITVATSATYPGLYAPMIHPWSGTGKLVDSNGNPDDSTLYWNMSLWGNYNVVLMKTDLSSLKATLV
ncbi:hypothetical protein FHT40_002972 [Mycolicibacterium sp. BK556]|uniref:DUF4185 domain-containing protein n=1 Tax=unclassified Mycolicibacterium TaxID=2636767 RepID=UPI001614EAB4|nr:MULTISPECIES: DUF4185 domain-containing protein [unclassified Mycolicibacterium]MBB3603311.1 hypothetical protein [Mycolicibacterium sp. BK556]MBB3633506.1 hypothetical protein [Mycolicibacterium sp. BK607]